MQIPSTHRKKAVESQADRWRRRSYTAAFLSLAAWLLAPATAADPDALDKAVGLYWRGNFGEALELLQADDGKTEPANSLWASRCLNAEGKYAEAE
ncbi:MAG: hypothetical protein ACRC1K_22590, partial [Planctomycetia bacterium]